MSSIFARIYGGILVVLVLVALLGAGALHMVNEVRGDHYRDDLVRGTVRLMADNLLPMDTVERRRALAMWSRLFGIPLRLQALDGAALEVGERKRLLGGQVLVKQTGPHAAKVAHVLAEQPLTLLTGEIEQISEQLLRATNYLLIDELVRYPVDEQPARLAEIRRDKQFGYAMRLQHVEQARLDEDQRRRIDEGDTVMALGRGGDSIYVFSGIVDTPWVLEIGPLYQSNPYPPQLLLLICVLALSLIGLMLYWLVRALERRLLALESAASHIASGRLDVRVPEKGADAIGRLAGSFNAMAQHLQSSLSTQRELVRAVSHELRTPVARLRFGLEMVADAPSEQMRRTYLDGMDGDIQDLDQLVDEMLTYARLEQGSPALTFKTVNVLELIDRVIEELGPLSAGVSVRRGELYSASGDYMVQAEPRYLHRALQNLVCNAQRHAQAQVLISCRVGHKRCLLEVEDDGPGVPEAAWDRLFSPFFRVDDSRTRASGGHGLGLSIVRRIIYWHGGRAQIARSECLGGARFSLLWPRQQEAG